MTAIHARAKDILTTYHHVHANRQIGDMREILIKAPADINEDLDRGATVDRGEMDSGSR